LKAYLIGVEVIDVVSRGVNQKTHVHYGQGWHSTETMGVFGGTAAVGILLGLNQEQMVNALSMAASESCGLQGNFGTMTKAFHAGRGAEKGILCARMAALGYGANPDIMEMAGGLALAMAGSLDAEAMRRKMASGQSAFIEPGLTMKPYPCCKCNHNMIDGTYNLMTEHGFNADEVAKVTIGVQPSFFGCLKYPEAQTPLEGKFSANFNVACVLVNGRRPAIRDFQGERITDAKLRETMDKVEMAVDHSIAGGAYANGGWDTKVKIVLKDGREFDTRVIHSRGESANPLSEEEVLEKLRDDCLAISLFEDKLEKVMELLRGLEKIADINQLTAAISEAAKPFPKM
jgi:2-methylcitrate dehydratase PrpD